MAVAIPSWLDAQTIYVMLSAVIAILIWIEGQMLKQTDGKLPKSKIFHVSSLLDTAWFFVSLAVIYVLELESIAVAVPVAYGIYTLFGWVYGSRLMKKNGMPDSPEDLIIPRPYIAYSQSFALIFFALCLLVLALPWLPKPT